MVSVFTLVTSIIPFLNMKLCTSCTATCTSNSDCFIYAAQSTSGTFKISSSVQYPSSYSVIYADSSIGATNTCDDSSDCYIFCTNSQTCTNTLSNLALSALPYAYNLIQCTGSN